MSGGAEGQEHERRGARARARAGGEEKQEKYPAHKADGRAPSRTFIHRAQRSSLVSFQLTADTFDGSSS